jgi:uncharacterized protein (DUF2252 family)
MAAARDAPSWLVPPRHASREALRAAGKDARRAVPRSSHAAWKPPPDRPDPVATLRAGDGMRVAALLPIRYGRMAQSPFTFFRGAAAIMAADVAALPRTGIRTQACGDCHVLNFGAFATPERHLAFDVNDFDETLPAAWEWDLKRLAASVAIAGRHLGFRRSRRRAALAACLAAYRTSIQGYAGEGVLDVWYARIDEPLLAGLVRGAETRREYETMAAKARSQTSAHAYPRLTGTELGRPRFLDEDGLTFHADDEAAFHRTVADMLASYRDGLPGDRRALLDRFRLADAAYHVVGVGSVGTVCLVALLLSADGEPLILQAKQALPSVLEAYADERPSGTHAERVVAGQRLMQAATDVFLGAARDAAGRDYYVRQLRDMKTSANVDRMTAADLSQYAAFCGWALARGHAKASGIAAAIAGYIGGGAAFDEALGEFAESYADQNERDYARLQEAIRAREIQIVRADA